MTPPTPIYLIGERDGLPDLPSSVTRQRNGRWTIETLVPCPYCNKRKHVHGGGSGPEPEYGSGHWVAHCPSTHRPFRKDCNPVRSAGGRTECGKSHGSERGYYLHLIPTEGPA